MNPGDGDDFQAIADGGGCVLPPFGVDAGLFRQQWPTRTVKVVVPYAVGGVTDTMARVTADRLGKMLNQTFLVENKPGAGGAIGVDYAVHAPQEQLRHSVCREAPCSPFCRWRRR